MFLLHSSVYVYMGWYIVCVSIYESRSGLTSPVGLIVSALGSVVSPHREIGQTRTATCGFQVVSQSPGATK